MQLLNSAMLAETGNPVSCPGKGMGTAETPISPMQSHRLFLSEKLVTLQ